MPAPVGNTNHTDGRIWRAALHRALEKRGRGDKIAALDQLAEALLSAADAGDIPALRELGDRLEGKAPQAITGADGGPFRMLLDAKDGQL